jgi:diaminohydroxyphosphoribosylaminopyrimidine deaminase/5-amino-6-(5-phosphoribosylamino)uracil reductase
LNEKEKYMQRCLELAQMGLGTTRANPLVGCVVIKDNKIISEGFHHTYGGAHAEVEALIKLDSSQVKDATVYVNLEPCSHHGKTPPCADLLISKGIKKVVIASVDPNPLVAGKGIEKLKAAGVKVEQGCDKENRELNRRFFTFHEKQRPYIILKWAQSEDGYIAPVHEGNYKLTGNLANILVHKWRSQEMGILVGRKTIDKDNPLLTVRHVSGKNPVRIVFDPQCKLNPEHDVFNTDAPTIVFNAVKNAAEKNVRHVKVESDFFLESVINFLCAEKMISILVEGGTETLRQFIEAGLWDEARIFTCPKKIRDGILAPVINGRTTSVDYIGTDQLTILVPNS